MDVFFVEFCVLRLSVALAGLDRKDTQRAGVWCVPCGVELVGGELQRERVLLKYPKRLLPILQFQTRYPLEFTCVVGYQGCIIRHGYRRNDDVIWANQLA